MNENAKKRVLAGFRLVVVVIVVYFLYRAIRDARSQLGEYEFSFSQVKPWWLWGAAAAYLVGMLPMCLYWHRLLYAMGQQPSLFSTLRAYFAGHLGKYVPGKAMVVVIRTDLLGTDRVHPVVAAISVFAETLTMMSIGALWATILIGIQFSDQRLMLCASIGMMVCAGAPTWPPIFRWIITKFKFKRLNPEIQTAISGYTWNIVFFGWIANLLGWICLAASLNFVLIAISYDAQMSIIVPIFLKCLAAVSLATVAGFLSLIPGGILVRELVIEELLAPSFGKALAIVSAVLLRLIWLFVELTVAAFLVFVGRKRPKNSPL